MVDEPVDLLVNGKLIARGDVVVVDEKFGLRITEIISPRERIESLR
jgi:flagellar motor switch protein FliN/FliY